MVKFHQQGWIEVSSRQHIPDSLDSGLLELEDIEQGEVICGYVSFVDFILPDKSEDQDTLFCASLESYS